MNRLLRGEGRLGARGAARGGQGPQRGATRQFEANIRVLPNDHWTQEKFLQFFNIENTW